MVNVVPEFDGVIDKTIGVEGIKVADKRVAMELKAPYNKDAWYITLNIDKTLKFNIDKSDPRCILKKIQGLKVDGNAVDKVEAVGDQINFSLQQK